MDLTEQVVESFDISRPAGPWTLEPLQRSDCEAWRLRSAANESSYLVKRLWDVDDEPQWSRVETAMSLERKAITAGVATALPVEPLRPTVGWATELAGHGCFRVVPWLEHRPLADDDDIAEWLGNTVAKLHSLDRQEDAGAFDWQYFRIWPAEEWRDWIARASSAAKPWTSALEQTLPAIEGLSRRLRKTYSSSPDLVTTHGDLERHNVLITESGPVLIDWETVWTYSAALQAGRVAFAFGHGDPTQMRQILAAYVAAGGTVDWAGEDLLLSTASHELATIAERIRVALALQSAPRWMNTQNLDDKLLQQLEGLSSMVARLTALAGSLQMSL